ncbi:hypothetical protein ABGB07_43285 [Micromonosporaceae bacterium B7E4]
MTEVVHDRRTATTPPSWRSAVPLTLLVVTAPFLVARVAHMPSVGAGSGEHLGHVVSAPVHGWLADYPALALTVGLLLVPLLGLPLAFPEMGAARAASGTRLPLGYAGGSALAGAGTAGFVTWLAASGAAGESTLPPVMITTHALVAARDCFVLGLVVGITALALARRPDGRTGRAATAATAVADTRE